MKSMAQSMETARAAALFARPQESWEVSEHPYFSEEYLDFKKRKSAKHFAQAKAMGKEQQFLLEIRDQAVDLAEQLGVEAADQVAAKAAQRAAKDMADRELGFYRTARRELFSKVNHVEDAVQQLEKGLQKDPRFPHDGEENGHIGSSSSSDGGTILSSPRRGRGVAFETGGVPGGPQGGGGGIPGGAGGAAAPSPRWPAPSPRWPVPPVRQKGQSFSPHKELEYLNQLIERQAKSLARMEVQAIHWLKTAEEEAAKAAQEMRSRSRSAKQNSRAAVRRFTERSMNRGDDSDDSG